MDKKRENQLRKTPSVSLGNKEQFLFGFPGEATAQETNGVSGLGTDFLWRQQINL